MNSQPICVANFYKFVELKDLERLAENLNLALQQFDIRGTILLAGDGVNANIGGSTSSVEAFEKEFLEIPDFAGIQFKKSYGTTVPFSRRRVKIKNSILCFDEKTQFKVEDFANTKRLSPTEWQKLLSEKSEEFVLLDTRNDYEFAYGSFDGATHLGIRHFREFQDKFLEKYRGQEDKKFLVFCTGGIRCEKVTAFAEKHGFKNCYQLDTGIIGYFKEQGQKQWHGSCFVFDFRWAVTPELMESGEGHYLEDGLRGSVHVTPQKAREAAAHWPAPQAPQN